VEDLPQVPAGEKTRDFIAQKSGLGTGRTYRQVAAVLEKGSPDLIEAMDSHQFTAYVSYHTEFTADRPVM